MQDKEEEEKASKLVGKPQKTDPKDLDDIVNLNLSALYGALLQQLSLSRAAVRIRKAQIISHPQ